jgi:D-methionine transport system substrate-binding protein
MKKLLLLAGIFLLCFGVLAACNREKDSDVTRIRVAATPRPHAEILEFIKPFLLEEGIDLEIVQFTDFFVLNPALAYGDVDANYFQHQPFLNNSPYANDLHMLGLIHIEPMGAYSYTLNSIGDLPDGATIAIPSDAPNGGRALLLLQTHGLLTLDPSAGILATPHDIIENPLNLRFEQLDAAMLPRILDDPAVDMAIINTNHVLTGTTLNPMRDSLIIETPDSPYGNGLAVRAEDAESEIFEILLRHLQSERVRQFILEQYDGSVVPVF